MAIHLLPRLLESIHLLALCHALKLCLWTEIGSGVAILPTATTTTNMIKKINLLGYLLISSLKEHNVLVSFIYKQTKCMLPSTLITTDWIYWLLKQVWIFYEESTRYPRLCGFKRNAFFIFEIKVDSVWDMLLSSKQLST